VNTIHIDPRSSTRIWSQIAQQVQLLVASGRLSAGDALPSVRELAGELIVNPATVAKAYRRLCDLGVAEVRRGQGTFVGDGDRGADRELSPQQATDACSRFVAVARTAGLDLEAAREMVHRTWTAMETGGSATGSDRGTKDSDDSGDRKEPA